MSSDALSLKKNSSHVISPFLEPLHVSIYFLLLKYLSFTRPITSLPPPPQHFNTLQVFLLHSLPNLCSPLIATIPLLRQISPRGRGEGVNKKSYQQQRRCVSFSSLNFWLMSSLPSDTRYTFYLPTIPQVTFSEIRLTFLPPALISYSFDLTVKVEAVLKSVLSDLCKRLYCLLFVKNSVTV